MIYPLRRLWGIKAQWMQATQLSASTWVSASDVLTFVWFCCSSTKKSLKHCLLLCPGRSLNPHPVAIQFIPIHYLIPPLDPQSQALRIKSERDSEKWDKGYKMTKKKKKSGGFVSGCSQGAWGWWLAEWGREKWHRTPPVPACNSLSGRWAAPMLSPHGRKWWVLSPKRRAFWA